tara:strand:- start:1152 stop:2213 length:1062 start_codon:yes stop_codon:yes gene_type:complete
MSDLRVNNITDRTGDHGPVIAGVSTVTGTGAFTIPVGPTEFRGGRGRAIIGAGGYPSGTNAMDYIDIATTGNGVDWGDLIQGDYGRASFSSSTRGVVGGGAGGSYVGTVEYQTISSSGGTADFGDLNIGKRFMRATGNNSRGTWMGGSRPSAQMPEYGKIIEYNEIATTGNASYFGDMVEGRSANPTCSSPTRGVTAGDQGYSPYTGVAAESKTIEYITFATRGNGTLFGELTSGIMARSGGGLSSNTRGIFAGHNPGSPAPANKTNVMEYITIATLGNSIDFGDLVTACTSLMGTSNNTRGIFAGGYASPSEINTIQYLTIATLGNAKDFGDLSGAKGYLPVAYSDSHGGIG